MKTYILKRFLLSIPLVFAMSFVVYFVMNLRGTDYFDTYALNPNVSKREIQTMKRQNGLDKPMAVRYFYWLRGICFDVKFSNPRQYVADFEDADDKFDEAYRFKGSAVTFSREPREKNEEENDEKENGEKKNDEEENNYKGDRLRIDFQSAGAELALWELDNPNHFTDLHQWPQWTLPPLLESEADQKIANGLIKKAIQAQRKAIKKKAVDEHVMHQLNSTQYKENLNNDLQDIINHAVKGSTATSLSADEETLRQYFLLEARKKINGVDLPGFDRIEMDVWGSDKQFSLEIVFLSGPDLFEGLPPYSKDHVDAIQFPVDRSKLHEAVFKVDIPAESNQTLQFSVEELREKGCDLTQMRGISFRSPDGAGTVWVDDLRLKESGFPISFGKPNFGKSFSHNIPVWNLLGPRIKKLHLADPLRDILHVDYCASDRHLLCCPSVLCS